jgi:peptidoglycan/LPS O-acetylase OafA/YrhL
MPETTSIAAPPTVMPQPAVEAPQTLRHLPGLDALRGVAILMVFAYHYVDVDHFQTWSMRIAQPVIHALWIGVDIFFVLSGFLITRILLRTRDEPGYFRNFYARRALRIFPLYFGVLAVVFGIFPLVMHDPPGAAIAPQQGWLWSYLANFRMTTGGAQFKDRALFFSHFWTLCVEEQFYLLWPLVVRWARRRTLRLICGAMIFIPLIARVILVARHANPYACYVLTFCRMDTLAAGGILALALEHPARRAWVGQYARWGFWIGLVGLAGFAAYFNHDLLIERAAFEVFGYPLVTLLGVSVVALLALAPASGVVSAVGRNRPLMFLGGCSYGFYIFHYLLLPQLQRVVPIDALAERTHSQMLAVLAFAFFGLLVMTTVALVSYHLFEKHFLRLKRFF